MGEQGGGKGGTLDAVEAATELALCPPLAVFGRDADRVPELEAGSCSPSLSPERSGTDSRSIRGSTDRIYSPSLNWISIFPLVRLAFTVTFSQPKFVCTLMTSPTCTSGRGSGDGLPSPFTSSFPSFPGSSMPSPSAALSSAPVGSLESAVEAVPSKL